MWDLSSIVSVECVCVCVVCYVSVWVCVCRVCVYVLYIYESNLCPIEVYEKLLEKKTEAYTRVFCIPCVKGTLNVPQKKTMAINAFRRNYSSTKD